MATMDRSAPKKMSTAISRGYERAENFSLADADPQKMALAKTYDARDKRLYVEFPCEDHTQVVCYYNEDGDETCFLRRC